MPFQIKQNTLNLSVPIERLTGAYYRIQRTKKIFLFLVWQKN